MSSVLWDFRLMSFWLSAEKQKYAKDHHLRREERSHQNFWQEDSKIFLGGVFWNNWVARLPQETNIRKTDLWKIWKIQNLKNSRNCTLWESSSQLCSLCERSYLSLTWFCAIEFSKNQATPSASSVGCHLLLFFYYNSKVKNGVRLFWLCSTKWFSMPCMLLASILVCSPR